jgi:hypothetical protein
VGIVQYTPATEGEAMVASAGWDVGAFALLSGQPDDN